MLDLRYLSIYAVKYLKPIMFLFYQGNLEQFLPQFQCQPWQPCTVSSLHMFVCILHLIISIHKIYSVSGNNIGETICVKCSFSWSGVSAILQPEQLQNKVHTRIFFVPRTVTATILQRTPNGFQIRPHSYTRHLGAFHPPSQSLDTHPRLLVSTMNLTTALNDCSLTI